MTQNLSYEELKDLVSKLLQEKDEALNKLGQIEKECNSKEGFFQQMIDKANEGMLILKGDKVKYINKTALKFFGCSKAEIETLCFSDFIIQSQRGQIIQNLANIISGVDDDISIDLDVVTKNGEVIKTEFVFEKIKSLTLNNLLLAKFEEKCMTELDIDDKSFIHKIKNDVTEEGLIILSKPNIDYLNLFSWDIEDVNKIAVKLFDEKHDNILNTKFSSHIISEFGYVFDKDIDNDFEDEFEIYVINLKKYIRFKIKCIHKDKLACMFIDVSELNEIKKQLEKNIRQNELVTEILGIINSEIQYDAKLDKIISRIAFYFSTNRVILLDHLLKEGFGVCKIQNSSNKIKVLSNFEIPFNNIPSYLKMLKERNMVLGFTTKYLPSDLNTFFEGMQFSNVYAFPIVVEGDIHASILFEANENGSWNSTEINYLKIVTRLIVTLFVRQFNEERLLKAKNDAISADKLKSSFLASMSHDIRIPMTSIIGFSDLLADPNLTLGEREEFIELITNSGQDLLSLVDNIIDISKIETGQMNIFKEEVSLKSIFRELYNKHISNIKLKEYDDLELILDFDNKYEDILFEADAFRFKQVFDNLIDNAIKFTDTGIIKFGINSVWDNTIEFYVQDTGMGINEETQQIIFESFSKADRSYTKEYNGTGLGLTLCKSIIELMGGEIRLVSYIGKGSTFYFTHNLPEGVSEQLVMDNVNQVKSDADWSNKTILIVEDVMHNYKCLEFILAPTEIKIMWAKNGREAVNYFAKGNKADVVLMDIRMPILNGLDATREILKKTKIPIIAQTAYTFGDEKQLAIDAGCSGYLTKPVQSNILIPFLENLFNKQ